jgi:hypothetical protein
MGLLFQEILSNLHEKWTDEEISVQIGRLLHGPGPSSRSIRRWRKGETAPHRMYQHALHQLDQENKNDQND